MQLWEDTFILIYVVLDSSKNFAMLVQGSGCIEKDFISILAKFCHFFAHTLVFHFMSWTNIRMTRWKIIQNKQLVLIAELCQGA